MAVYTPYSPISEVYQETSYPPDETADYWVRYWEVDGSHPPYTDSNTDLAFYFPAYETGTAELNNVQAQHQSKDGTKNTKHSVFFNSPPYAPDSGAAESGNVTLIFRAEGQTGGKWMQMRFDIRYASSGQGNGEADVYFEDSEGFKTDHYAILPGWPISQFTRMYMELYINGDGTNSLKLYEWDNNRTFSTAVTSNLFAAEEEIKVTFKYTVAVQQQYNQYMSIYAHYYDMIVYGVWTNLEGSVEYQVSPWTGWVGDHITEGEWIGGWRDFVFGSGFSGWVGMDHIFDWWDVNTDYDRWQDYVDWINIYRIGTSSDWWLKFKFSVPVFGAQFHWKATHCYQGVPGLTDANNTKGFYLSVNSSRFSVLSIPDNTILYLGTNTFHTIGDPWNEWTIEIINEWCKVKLYEIDTGQTTSHEFSIRDMFDVNDEVYPIYWNWNLSSSYTYCGFAKKHSLRSPVITGNADYGQDPVPAHMFCSGRGVELVELTELAPEDRVCYYRTKIINPDDPTDSASLKGINPGYPSDVGLPLQESDSVLIKDQYNRAYFYKAKTGDMADDLPDVMRITDSLYWQLIDAIGNELLLVEQYDIVGLVDTNDVIITHTEQNRATGCYCPAVQVIHNGFVRTNGIIVSVKSSTEIRIATEETTVLTNLKINLYITPV